MISYYEILKSIIIFFICCILIAYTVVTSMRSYDGAHHSTTTENATTTLNHTTQRNQSAGGKVSNPHVCREGLEQPSLMANFDAEFGINFAISLRCERPVEGCEVTPHASLFIKGGAMDNSTRAKMMEANQHYFYFTWKRGPRRQMCENVECPRRDTCEPVEWSRVALGGPALQCAVCEKAGIPKHESLFCSKRWVGT